MNRARPRRRRLDLGVWRTVVGQLGRVHGLEGLRAADASMVPDRIRANTQAIIMAIGERIADLRKNGE